MEKEGNKDKTKIDIMLERERERDKNGDQFVSAIMRYLGVLM